jgi:DNA-binding transcriptional LysR family regulator
MVNLRGIDLNLLVILEALLEEAHVSRAAERLHLSQPATSNALTRARALFGDPLLIRAPGGLRRTARAEQLRGPLREALARMRGLIGAPAADLATIRQTVRLVLADFPAVVVGPPLLARIAAEAPGIELVFHPWHSGDEIERLRRSEIDLTTTIEMLPADDLRFENIGRFRYQVVMRRDHPAAADFSLERWLAYPHLLVSGSARTRGPIDLALAQKGLERRVGAVVPTFLLGLQFLETSDLIAALPMALLPEAIKSRFILLEPPIDLDSFPMTMVRHRRSDDDAAVRFVADVIKAQINPASGLDGSA